MATGTSGTKGSRNNPAVNELPRLGYIGGELLWGADGVNWIQENLNITKQEAKRYQDAIAHFTGGNYEEIIRYKFNDLDYWNSKRTRNRYKFYYIYYKYDKYTCN